jgi:hypothetical protein
MSGLLRKTGAVKISFSQVAIFCKHNISNSKSTDARDMLSYEENVQNFTSEISKKVSFKSQLSTD